MRIGRAIENEMSIPAFFDIPEVNPTTEVQLDELEFKISTGEPTVKELRRWVKLFIEKLCEGFSKTFTYNEFILRDIVLMNWPADCIQYPSALNKEKLLKVFSVRNQISKPRLKSELEAEFQRGIFNSTAFQSFGSHASFQ
jgi:hypothetical protein